MIKQVERVIKILETGATFPVDGIIESERAIIKTFNNRWSNKILINEYICYRLAEVIQLPIPESGICNITENTIIDDAVEDELDYDESIDGIGFYSKRLEKVNKYTPNKNIVKQISNKEDINKILLFDHLIYNDDRHDGNLLLQLSTAKIYIIDHSHVFNLTYQWTEEKLMKLMDSEDFRDLEIMNNNLDLVYRPFIDLGIITIDKLYKYAELFRSRITKELIQNIIDELPKEWIIDKNDVNKLGEYIYYRLKNIDKIIEVISRFIIMTGGE